jgi:hypothetical protein
LDNDSLTNLEEYIRNTDPTKYDTDGDGYSDKVDENPNDPDSHKKETEDPVTDLFGYIAILLLVVVIIIILLISIIILRNRSQRETKFTPDDELYSKVMQDILFDYEPNGMKLSSYEIKDMLDKKLKNGQISQETYNDMLDLNQSTEKSQQNNQE